MTADEQLALIIRWLRGANIDHLDRWQIADALAAGAHLVPVDEDPQEKEKDNADQKAS